MGFLSQQTHYMFYECIILYWFQIKDLKRQRSHRFYLELFLRLN